MPVLRITKHGEEVLKRSASPVDFDEIAAKIPGILDDMWETMYAANGVGLAAPQIGLPLRISVIDLRRPEEKSERLVLINPEIIATEGEVREEEGCLSLPGLYAKVKRFRRVTLKALDRKGRPWERTATGLLARAFQHETDHLDGKLFIDRLDLAARLNAAKAMKDLRKTWS